MEKEIVSSVKETNWKKNIPSHNGKRKGLKNAKIVPNESTIKPFRKTTITITVITDNTNVCSTSGCIFLFLYLPLKDDSSNYNNHFIIGYNIMYLLLYLYRVYICYFIFIEYGDSFVIVFNYLIVLLKYTYPTGLCCSYNPCPMFSYLSFFVIIAT